MNWHPMFLCFELISPIHLGFLPNQPGTVLAPTRCYVPGKSIWGAVTEKLVPRLFLSPTAADFHRVGDEIKRELYFSYFYLSDGKSIFNPDYTPEGLKWGDLSEREFRGRFTSSQVSTAIARKTGTAQEESLHDLEFIRHRVGSPQESHQKALLVGAVWVADGARMFEHSLQIKDGSIFVGDDIDLFEEITVGGERNYGFGRIKRVPCTGALVAEAKELWAATPDQDIQLREDKPLPAHLPYRQECIFFGDIEVLAGREYEPHDNRTPFRNPGQCIRTEPYHFVPGTRVYTPGLVRYDSWGRLAWKD